jgi:hypothetical protein
VVVVGEEGGQGGRCCCTHRMDVGLRYEEERQREFGGDVHGALALDTPKDFFFSLDQQFTTQILNSTPNYISLTTPFEAITLIITRKRSLIAPPRSQPNPRPDSRTPLIHANLIASQPDWPDQKSRAISQACAAKLSRQRLT